MVVSKVLVVEFFFVVNGVGVLLLFLSSIK